MSKYFTAKSREEAWEIVNREFPTDYLKDEQRSAGAGYPIYYSTRDGFNAWISDLNMRLEMNYPVYDERTGKMKDFVSVNVWIEPEKQEEEMPEQETETAAEPEQENEQPVFIAEFRKEQSTYTTFFHMIMKGYEDMADANKAAESYAKENGISLVKVSIAIPAAIRLHESAGHVIIKKTPEAVDEYTLDDLLSAADEFVYQVDDKVGSALVKIAGAENIRSAVYGLFAAVHNHLIETGRSCSYLMTKYNLKDA